MAERRKKKEKMKGSCPPSFPPPRKHPWVQIDDSMFGRKDRDKHQDPHGYPRSDRRFPFAAVHPDTDLDSKLLKTYDRERVGYWSPEMPTQPKSSVFPRPGPTPSFQPEPDVGYTQSLHPFLEWISDVMDHRLSQYLIQRTRIDDADRHMWKYFALVKPSEVPKRFVRELEKEWLDHSIELEDKIREFMSFFQVWVTKTGETISKSSKRSRVYLEEILREVSMDDILEAEATRKVSKDPKIRALGKLLIDKEFLYYFIENPYPLDWFNEKGKQVKDRGGIIEDNPYGNSYEEEDKEEYAEYLAQQEKDDEEDEESQKE